jgi:hypothetical protein
MDLLAVNGLTCRSPIDARTSALPARAGTTAAPAAGARAVLTHGFAWPWAVLSFRRALLYFVWTITGETSHIMFH